MVWDYGLVFLSFVWLDFAWAEYMSAVSKKHAHRAGMWSGVITIIAGFGAIQYVDNNWLLIPAVAGGYLGTVIAVRREQ